MGSSPLSVILHWSSYATRRLVKTRGTENALLTVANADKQQNEVRRDFGMRSLLRKTRARSNGFVYPVRQERVAMHKKAIINGKLYDTEKADFVCLFGGKRVLLKTKKGHYFSCEQSIHTWSKMNGKEIVDNIKIMYSNPREESVESVKAYTGIHELGLYIKLFGEVEEA